ncbi:MAG: biotin transporter BioY [Candidatus Acetothermia bacterium]
MELMGGDSKVKQRTFPRITELKEGTGLKEGALVSLGLALITGLAAQIRLPLPFSPVPVTGQVFVVLLIGILFGRKLGLGSQLFYVGLGGVGLPLFSGFSGGAAALAGPTGGYILGFLPAVYLVGWLSESITLDSLLKVFSAGLAGLGAIYLFGSAQLALFLNTGLRETVALGVVPFIWIDLVKALLVALVTKVFNQAEF